MILSTKPFYKEIYSYTLNEFLSEDDLISLYDSLLDIRALILNFTNSKLDLNKWLGESFYNENSSYINDVALLLILRYKDYIIFESDKELTNEEKEKELFNFAVKIANIYKMTTSRYGLLLSLYDNNKNKLLDAIKTSSELDSRFNDTPQDEGTFEEATHNTNVSQSKSVSTNERDTLIERLNDISNKYRNLLLEWCDEFKGVFIERTI